MLLEETCWSLVLSRRKDVSREGTDLKTAGVGTEKERFTSSRQPSGTKGIGDGYLKTIGMRE